MPDLSNKGMNALVRSHIEVIKKHAPGQQTWIEVGVINDDYSLQVSGLDEGIPANYWWTLLPLTVSTLFLDTQPTVEDDVGAALIGMTVSGTSLQHTHPSMTAHHHVVRLPAHFMRPRPGDSVLVAWIKGGQSPVILGILRRGAGGESLPVTPGEIAGG